VEECRQPFASFSPSPLLAFLALVFAPPPCAQLEFKLTVKSSPPKAVHARFLSANVGRSGLLLPLDEPAPPLEISLEDSRGEQVPFPSDMSIKDVLKYLNVHVTIKGKSGMGTELEKKQPKEQWKMEFGDDRCGHFHAVCPLPWLPPLLFLSFPELSPAQLAPAASAPGEALSLFVPPPLTWLSCRRLSVLIKGFKVPGHRLRPDGKLRKRTANLEIGMTWPDGARLVHTVLDLELCAGKPTSCGLAGFKESCSWISNRWNVSRSCAAKPCLVSAALGIRPWSLSGLRASWRG
jgi:hypothetical protein